MPPNPALARLWACRKGGNTWLPTSNICRLVSTTPRHLSCVRLRCSGVSYRSMVRRAFDPKDILDSNEGMEKRWWLEEHNKLRRQQREDRSRRRRGEFARGGEEKQEDDDEDGLEEGPPDGTAKPETTPSCLEGTLPGESRSLSPFELMVQKQSATLPGPRCEVNATRERLKHFWMEQGVKGSCEKETHRKLLVDACLEWFESTEPPSSPSSSAAATGLPQHLVSVPQNIEALDRQLRQLCVVLPGAHLILWKQPALLTLHASEIARRLAALHQAVPDVDLEQIVTQDPMLLIYNYSDAVDLARKTEQKRWNGSVIR
ncbi:hypothetical protein CYMTET_16173 [Cymbomonas tetramitiformis]|uniref:Uncharacterized protein n=1 Tax=Cymbomonas tetramitiformis TaxID=36881 RepID=A0AAE0GCN8_9CHLO|nr:hypothetical protein CYMTET_16173 [Cymbomonas tetramitiformis]